jgi:hypothetical protein
MLDPAHGVNQGHREFKQRRQQPDTGLRRMVIFEKRTCKSGEPEEHHG